MFKNQLDIFVDNFRISTNQSSNTKSFLLKVMRFLLMFMLVRDVSDLEDDNYKYKFKITYVTGSINNMESGSIFRSLVLQQRLTPQSILESTLDDKFPLLLKHTKNPTVMRSRIHKAIDTEKDHLLQRLLISIDTTARWIPIKAQPAGDDENTNKVVLHMSCHNKSVDSVLYVENDGFLSTYCFDLLTLYQRFSDETDPVNEHSGKKFRPDFILDIMSINKKELDDQNKMIEIRAKENEAAKKLQESWKKFRTRMNTKIREKSKWLITHFLTLPNIHEKIETATL